MQKDTRLALLILAIGAMICLPLAFYGQSSECSARYNAVLEEGYTAYWAAPVVQKQAILAVITAAKVASDHPSPALCGDRLNRAENLAERWRADFHLLTPEAYAGKIDAAHAKDLDRALEAAR